MRLIGAFPKLRRLARALALSTVGAAAVEFAIVVPLLVTLMLSGIELANYATVQMQVSQIAVSLADNASRLGQTDNSSVTPTITESDVNSILSGAVRQGAGINLATNGRVIISSLEQDPVSGRQWVHWQRCSGNLSNPSTIGAQGAGLTGAVLTGAGNGSGVVTAPAGSAVMVAEVYYRYQGMFGTYFVSTPVIHRLSAFLNRDNRNLGTTSTAGLSPSGTASSC